MQVLQNLASYPDAGQIVADQQLQPAQQEQLEQHILRPADVICALNFSVFLLSSRWDLVPTYTMLNWQWMLLLHCCWDTARQPIVRAADPDKKYCSTSDLRTQP